MSHVINNVTNKFIVGTNKSEIGTNNGTNGTFWNNKRNNIRYDAKQ